VGQSKSKLPSFTADEVLPAGDYSLTLNQLAESFLVRGPGGQHYPNWDAEWRGKLVANLSVLLLQLRQVGVTEIYVDGSFVEDKDHPNDIDGYFLCERARITSGDLVRELNLLDPNKVWTWDWNRRRTYCNYPKPQLPMWHFYRVELFPHYGQRCGIKDEFGHELEFPAAFRKSRYSRRPRGIVKIGE
jgi:hypothetical protein